MKVQTLLMSGCSTLTRQTITYNCAEQKFAYAGDAHIYIFDLKESAYRLESIIPFCEKSEFEESKNASMYLHDSFGGVGVSCLDFSTTNTKLLAAVTLKTKLLEIWDTQTNQLVKFYQLQNRILQVSWSPTNPKLILLHADNLTLKVINVENGSIEEVNITGVTAARWHPRQAGFVLVGTLEGRVLLYNFEKKKPDIEYNAKEKIDHEQDLGVDQNKVVDLIWNPGEDNFLALFKDSRLQLFAQDEVQPKMDFEKQQVGISKVCWLDTVSGDFITSSIRVGVLRVWNASQQVPKDVIKVSRHGVISILPCQRDHFLLTLVSGQIVLFNTKTRKVLYITDVAHTHQIQRVRINPQIPNLMASAAFDGSLRIWDLRNLSLQTIFEDRQALKSDKIIQSCAWFTPKQQSQQQQISNDTDCKNLIVVGTQQGRVKLIDLEKNRVIWKEDVVTEGIFDLDWSSNGILAIANLTKSCVFKKYDHKTRSFSHHISLLLADSSRCLKFNPFDQNLIAIGVFNGTTVIYDVETCQILQTLKSGSTLRILCLEWHPQLPNVIVTGSFDHSVMVYDIKANNCKQLVHHKDRVRSVIWNSELPWMLITGSDDSMIVIWDTRSSKVVTSTYEPTLSLTSFTSHPQRPFTLVSSHFDSSIIIWSLLSLPEVALSQLKFLLGVNLNEIFSTPEESLMSEQMKLTGAQSRQVSDQNKKKKLIEQHERSLKFFQGQDGQEEFWAMVQIQSGQGPQKDSDGLRVNHIQDIIFAYQSRARELLQMSGMKMLGTALSKKEDRLAEAANLMIKAGNFQEYCEIQIQLGNYEDAIAYAPKVSLPYWKKCVEMYEQVLKQAVDGQLSVAVDRDSVQELVNYNILTGDFKNAANVYDQAGKTQSAELIKIIEIAKGFPYMTVADRHQINKSVVVELSNQPKTVHDLGPFDKDLAAFTNLQAQRKFEQREPLLAAAIHLSLNDVRKAIQKLLLSNNPEYAFVLAQSFDKTSLDHICTVLFQKTMFYDQMAITNQLFDLIKNGNLKEILELSLYQTNEGEIRSARKPQSGVQSVCDLLAQNNIKEAVKTCNQLYQKCNKGDTTILVSKVYESFFLLSFFNLTEVGQADYQVLISHYRDLALIKSLYWRMFSYFRWLVQTTQQTCIQTNFISSLSKYGGFSDVQLSDLVSDAHNKFFTENFAALEEHLRQYKPSFVGNFGINEFKHINALKRKGMSRSQQSRATSIITGISSVNLQDNYILINDGRTDGYLSIEEAFDVSLLIPYNPMLLKERETLNPFQRHYAQQRTSSKGSKFSEFI